MAIDEQKLISNLLEYSQIDTIGVPSSPTRGPNLVEGDREILIVDKHTFIKSNYVGPAPDKRGLGRTSIRLDGKPSPSSTVKCGYVHFVQRDDLRTPKFDAKKLSIEAWFEVESLPLVLEQLRQKNRYYWIGAFPNNLIYADIHAN